MNTTDFHHLLAAPTVSRNTFFTKLLVEASLRPLAERPFEEVAAPSLITVLPTPPAAGSQPSATGFPA